MEIAPVAGSRIAACTKADCAEFDSLQGPAVASVAVSWYGVASPAALNASFGTISVQLVLGVAGGGARPAAWAAASCISAFRRSVRLGLVCAYADDTSNAVMPNTAQNPVRRCNQDFSILR